MNNRVMKKRILSILLVLCMVLTFVPTTVFAEGGNSTVTLTALDGTGTGNEGYEKLIDSDRIGTHWCVDLPEGGAYIVFEASDVIQVTAYTLTTGRDYVLLPDSNPKNWTLYGCNDYIGKDTGTWTALHTVTDDQSMWEIPGDD